MIKYKLARKVTNKITLVKNCNYIPKCFGAPKHLQRKNVKH